MKIIDLLNKIANGEEVPKKINYKNKIYEWKEYDVCYGKIMTKKGWTKEHGYVAEENKTYFYLQHCYQDLNDTVETLEEEKKIPEKLELPKKFEIGGCNVRIGSLGFVPTESIVIDVILSKINDIIDYLDYLKSKGE